jgi:hypothetical protein
MDHKEIEGLRCDGVRWFETLHRHFSDGSPKGNLFYLQKNDFAFKNEEFQPIESFFCLKT